MVLTSKEECLIRCTVQCSTVTAVDWVKYVLEAVDLDARINAVMHIVKLYVTAQVTSSKFYIYI